MKNLLFGLITIGVLVAISSIVVSPELTDFFVDEDSFSENNRQPVRDNEPSGSFKSPEQVLRQTGHDWENFSEPDRLKFVLHLAKGLKSRDIDISDPNLLLEQINTYYETNPKETTVETAVMTIISENWIAK